jgi:hypothetical protein
MKTASQYWVGPGLLLLLLCLTQSPVLNPDALEMGLVGKGYFGMESQGLDLAYYPPLYPLLSAFFAAFMGGHAALVALNLFSVMALVFLLQRLLLRRGADVVVGLTVALVGFSLPQIREMALSADPRALQLVLLFLGLALLRPEPRLSHTKALGVVAALLLMCRPEGLLFAGILLVGAMVLWRREAVTSVVFFLGLLLPYAIWISRSVGSLSLSSRAWEIKGVALLGLLPVRPLIQLWGAGATSTPYRELLQQVEVSGSLPRTGFAEAFFAASSELAAGIPVLVLLLALFGATRLWRSERFLLGSLFAIVLGSMALYLVPMGRDLALPLINLLPAVVALWVMAACGALRLVGMGRSRVPLPGPLWVLLLLGPLCFFSMKGGGRIQSSSPSQASAWLQAKLAPDTRVASSLGSSAIIRRAGISWERVVARWERPVLWRAETEPDLLLLSSVDGTWMLGAPLLDSEMPLIPLAYFQDEAGWVLLLDLKAARRQMNEPALIEKILHDGEAGLESPGPLEEGVGDLDTVGLGGP